MKKQTGWFQHIVMILIWLLIWQITSMAIDNTIIFVGPAGAVHSFAEQALTLSFWKAIGNSLIRISAGFLTAFLFGTCTACLSYRNQLLRDFLKPVILLMKSVPVASFIILALIWAGSENLSAFISLIMVFPIIYINTLSGLLSTDKKLLEMAKVFQITWRKKALYIYAPAMYPYLISGCRTSIGMSWKAGIAAEVIGVPAYSIGEKLYMSKIYLDTAGLFAWTFVIILVSSLFEKLFLLLLSYIGQWLNLTSPFHSKELL